MPRACCALTLTQLQARVTIVDTTEAGILQFEQTHTSVPVTHDHVDMNVVRKGGCSGVMRVDYFTQSDTAVAGTAPYCFPSSSEDVLIPIRSVQILMLGVCCFDAYIGIDSCSAGLDFTHQEGHLLFESGESKKTISISLMGQKSADKSFTVCLRPANDTSTLSGGIQVRTPCSSVCPGQFDI